MTQVFESRKLRRTAAALSICALGITTLPVKASTQRVVAGPRSAMGNVGAMPDGAYAPSLQVCGQIRAQDVLAAVASRQAARARTALAVAPPPISWKSNPKAYHAFLFRTEPKAKFHASSHPMTALEFATFGAANLVDKDGMSVAGAIRSCSAQAAHSLAHSAPNAVQTQCPIRVGPGSKIDNSCEPQHCAPAIFRHNASNGTYDIVNQNSVCTGKPSTSTSFSASGQPQNSGTMSLVTITGYPGSKGPIPGIQATMVVPGHGTAVADMPAYPYSAQSGWVPLVGVVYHGAQLYGYINPNDKSVTVNFDSYNYYVSFITSYDGIANSGDQIYYDFDTTTGYTAVIQADAIMSEDNSTQNDLLACVGSAVLFGAAVVSLLSVPVDGPIGVAGASVIGSELLTIGSCDAAFEDLSGSPAGGGTSSDGVAPGGSGPGGPPVSDDDIEYED